MNKLLRFLIYFLLTCLLTVPVFALDNTLLLADVPIAYGESNFIERIEQRTGGTREPLGLVLSGGSARAFAHIGVLKYLEENDIVPDFIISNSMGSIIGLLYAAGFSPDEIYDMCANIPLTTFFEPQIPLNSGLINVQKFLSYVSNFIPEETKIENLDIPILIIGEDLSTKRSILMAEGDFLQVLQASFALPVFFDSVNYKDHIILDGGIANIAPLNFAYKYGNNNIVVTTFYNNKTMNLKNPLTGLNVSIDIGKSRQGIKEIKEHPEAVWIRCAVEDVSFMMFSKIDYLQKQGYSSAANMGEEIKKIATNTHSTITAQMQEKREKIAPLIKKEQENFLLYDHADAISFSNLNTINTWNSTLDTNYSFMSDSIGLGFGNLSKWKNMTVEGIVGGESTINNYGWVYPGINTKLSLYFGKVKFSIAGDFVFTSNNDINEDPSGSLYANQLLQINLHSSKSLTFNFVESAEYIKDPSNLRKSYWSEKEALSSFLFDTQLTKNRNSLRLVTGLQSTWQITDISSFLYAKITGMSFMFNSQFFLQGSATTRIALNSADDVFLSSKDGYITTNEDFTTSGILGYSTEKNNYLAIAGFETGYLIKSKPTFGEVILLEKFAISGFVNYIWFEKSNTPLIPNTNFGLKIAATPSLIGLNSFKTESIVSYDTSNKAIYIGISIK